MAATLTLANGRSFSFNNSHIIQYLDNSSVEITDLEELVQINERRYIQEEFDSIRKLIQSQNKSSTFLGSIGEKYIQDELTNINVAWKDTNKIPNNADIELEIKNTPVLVDVKNYSQSVPSHEVDKLYFDCKTNSVRFAILISLKSSIAKRRSFEVEYRDDQIMLFVRVQTQFDINYAINIMTALIDMNKDDYRKYIKKDLIEKLLNEVNTKTKEIVKMKQKCNDMLEYTEKFNKDMQKILNEYQNEIMLMINSIKDECANPTGEIVETCIVVPSDFKYQNWINIINDLISLDYNLEYTKQSKQSVDVHAYLDTHSVAQITFQKGKVLVSPAKSHKTTHTVENNDDWNKLITAIFK